VEMAGAQLMSLLRIDVGDRREESQHIAINR
jgi:hypothetical protein